MLLNPKVMFIVPEIRAHALSSKRTAPVKLREMSRACMGCGRQGRAGSGCLRVWLTHRESWPAWYLIMITGRELLVTPSSNVQFHMILRLTFSIIISEPRCKHVSRILVISHRLPQGSQRRMLLALSCCGPLRAPMAEVRLRAYGGRLLPRFAWRLAQTNVGTGLTGT